MNWKGCQNCDSFGKQTSWMYTLFFGICNWNYGTHVEEMFEHYFPMVCWWTCAMPLWPWPPDLAFQPSMPTTSSMSPWSSHLYHTTSGDFAPHMLSYGGIGSDTSSARASSGFHTLPRPSPQVDMGSQELYQTLPDPYYDPKVLHAVCGGAPSCMVVVFVLPFCCSSLWAVWVDQ